MGYFSFIPAPPHPHDLHGSSWIEGSHLSIWSRKPSVSGIWPCGFIDSVNETSGTPRLTCFRIHNGPGRRERQAAEERALECQAALANERQAFVEQSLEHRRRTTAELSATKQQAEVQMEDVTSNLRSQVGACVEN